MKYMLLIYMDEQSLNQTVLDLLSSAVGLGEPSWTDKYTQGSAENVAELNRALKKMRKVNAKDWA